VIVDMGFLIVIPVFIILAVVVTMGNTAVVVRMRVPRSSMLEFVPDLAAGVVMANVPVVVRVLDGRMGMGFCSAVAVGPLICHV
jgi:hypothetical protein